MRLGLISDSHGRVDRTRSAVQLLVARGADVLLHMGDVGGVPVIDELIGHNARMVFGNCDDDLHGLVRYAEVVGVHVDHPMGVLRVGGKKIAYTHGHRPELIEQAVRAGAEYVLHGHTHEMRDERAGRVRFINPGALFRAHRYTAALLDPRADQLEFIDIA